MLFSLFFTFLNLEPSEEVLVHLKYGPVRGNVQQIGEQEVYVFRNIPYARQPIGDLRFQLPEEPKEWVSEEDLQPDTKIHCPQNSFYEDDILPDVILGQEDCLFLDVYIRKSEVTGNVSLPVLIYFHGGKFNSGSKEDYGPDFLLRFNKMILVVPNYRLGILGFLSFHDRFLPGNLGLWDQNEVLKWVSKNIDQFGGDPEKVTIAGHEAGGASVGLHVLTSSSHEYFQGAISGSGTALSPWLVNTNPSTSTGISVAEALGCPTMSKSETITCLKTVSLSDILKFQGEAKNLIILPTIDDMAMKPFLPFSPKSMYQKGYQRGVNYLIGFTDREASYEVAREFPNTLKYKHLDKMIQHFLKPHFKNSLNFEMISKAAKYHYLRGKMIPSFESIEHHIAKMMTDFLFRSPVEQVVKLHREKTENIFVYLFKLETENYCGLERRKCFGNEFYVFNTSRQSRLNWPHLHFENVIKTVSKLWGNFVSLGYPDVHGRWKPQKDVDAVHYAEISDIIQPKFSQASDDREFWISLITDLEAAVNMSHAEYVDAHPVSEYSTIGAWALAVLFSVLCVALIGVVVITKKRTLTMSILPVSSTKDITYARS